MKISQVNNQSYEPNFKAKIEAPKEFWEAISKSSKSKLRKVNDAITYIKDVETLPGDTIEFYEYEDKAIIAAYSQRTNIEIAQKYLNLPFGNWSDLVIKTAKVIKEKFAEFSEVYQKAHS